MKERLRRGLGLACVVAGAGLLAHSASATAAGALWQKRAAVDHAVRAMPGDPFARLRIARLGLDVMVIEGTDRRELALGPGHMPGSALPGESDNCIIAGHRDGAFARLRSVRRGDIVEVGDAGRGVRYRVDGVTIVDRKNTALLAPTDRGTLTLVTCHPFNYVGRAPRRFVVRAAMLNAPAGIPG